MYLKSFTTKQTADRAVITADWRDRFHKPADVTITAYSAAGSLPEGIPAITMAGDVKDVHGVLFGCAQIAWSLGWRPKGLLPAIMNMLTSFKPLPPGPQGR